MTRETLTVMREQTPLDLLLWRRFRREVPGLVERTLALNPGLAGAGVMLPIGAKVVVDLPQAQPAAAPARLVRLVD